MPDPRPEPNMIQSIDPDHIETIFKVVQPLKQIDGGHGFIGVLLRDKHNDKIQCHICGDWHVSVGKHSQVAHDVPADEYRYKFGLPLGFPLCNHEISKRNSDRAIEKNLAKKNFSKQWNKATLDRIRRKAVRNHKHGKLCAAIQNKRGACPEQINRRYLIVSDIVGREASLNDVRKYDNPLLSIIIHRFGTFNKFKSAQGYSITKRSKDRWEGDELISKIRKFAKDNRRIPYSQDFRGQSKYGLPSYNAFRRVFGSWSRALKASGFESCNLMGRETP